MKRARLYLHLFHGSDDVGPSRDKLSEEGRWGFDGPVLRVDGFHVTYLTTFRIGLPEEVDPNHDWVELSFVDDCLYYDGKYYGDWSIFAHSISEADLIARAEDVDPAKLVAPIPPEQETT